MANNKVLLIKCKDEKGIIHKVSGVLLEFGCNIIRNREFVDVQQGIFYMRTEFEALEFKKEEVLSRVREVLPENSEVEIPKSEKKKVVLLATKEHHCVSELLSRNHFEEFNFKISAIVANHEDLRDLADRFGIDFHHISCEGIEKEEQEKIVLDILEKEAPDYIVLAKYMRILSPEFVEKYKGKIINIHHSFLPAFIGANPYRQAYERGVKLIGATAHFVTSELDQGPIITQDVAKVNHADNVSAMKRISQDVEKLTLSKAVKLACEDKVIINGNKTIVFE